jgi:hypothetical protein
MSTLRTGRLGWLGCAAGALALGACGAAHDPAASALAPYAQATLTAGVGWGDLRLGQTTLGEVAQRFGEGDAHLIGGNELAFEVAYERGQVAFLFRIDAACCPVPPDFRAQPGWKSVWDWARTLPCLREQKLASISVSAQPGDRQPFYRGASDKGTRLCAGAPAEIGFARPAGHPAHVLAGELGGSGPLLCFPSGIGFGGDSTAGGSLRRITIYAPEP